MSGSDQAAGGRSGSPLRVVVGPHRRGTRRALASMSGVRVVGEVADIDRLAPTVDALAPAVVVADLPEPDPLSQPLLTRVLRGCIGTVLVAQAPVRDRLLGWLQAGVRGVVDASELEFLPVAIRSAARRLVFVSPTASTVIVDGTAWPTAAPPVTPTLAEACSALTTREKAVLLALTGTRPMGKIAADLGIAESTANRHAHAVYNKLGVHGRLAAAAWARAAGFDSPTVA